MAAHSDGSPVTPDSPARLGETIALYGTGIGPIRPTPLDGFKVPSQPDFVSVDPVLVLIQGRSVTPAFAGLLAGAVGIGAVRFEVPDSLDRTAAVELSFQSGGVFSNVIPLPVK
jgi:uncharacterized protein (TIGR03437 family)